MNKTQVKSKKAVWLVLTTLFISLAFFWWLKTAENSKLKLAVLKALPLPAFRVENDVISAKEILNRFDAAKLVDKTGTLTDAPARQKILERAIYEKKLAILARQKKAKVTDWQALIDSPAADLKSSSILSQAAEARAREDAFKFWFYGQKNLNARAYALAAYLLNATRQGKDFGELAKTYSQDPSSAALAGDLGPVESDSLLFELKEPLLQAKIDGNLILPSRLGLHLIQVYLKKISPSGKDVLYLKQIYLKGADFEAWAKEETKNYKITSIIKL